MLWLENTGFLNAPKALFAAEMRSLTSALSVASSAVMEPRYLNDETMGMCLWLLQSTGAVFSGLLEALGSRLDGDTNNISLLDFLFNFLIF